MKRKDDEFEETKRNKITWSHYDSNQQEKKKNRQKAKRKKPETNHLKM